MNQKFSDEAATFESKENLRLVIEHYLHLIQYSEQLLPIGTEIVVRDTGDSSYGRIVGEIFRANQSINLQMVREGKAVVYCKYLDNCASARNAYLNAEATAKKEGRGVWNPNQPWTQRRELQPCSA